MTKLIKWWLSGWLFTITLVSMSVVALLDWDWSFLKTHLREINNTLERYAKDKKHITGNQLHYELCSKKCVDYPNTDCKCSHADFNK
jgi:hypothetical protein